MKRSYVAVIRKEKKSEYGVSFPDLPGCATAGRDLDEAYKMALEALQFHVDGLVEEKMEVPEASLIEEVKNMNKDGVAFFLVPITIPKSKAERINITVPQFVLSKVDNYAKSNNQTRSALFARAALSFIKEKHVTYKIKDNFKMTEEEFLNS